MPAETLDPPAAPPSGVNIVEGAPPKPPPAPTRTIRVSEMSSPGGTPATDKGPPTEPVRKGTAMDRLTSDLRKKAGVAEGAPAEQPPSVATPAAEAQIDSPPDNKAGLSPDKPAPSTDPKAAPADGKGAKVNPWKLVDEYKGKLANTEKENLDLKNRLLPEQDRKSYDERVTKAEARVKELEDEIRYVNYEKHPDFIKDYQQPYDRAWQLATAELSEIAIIDPQTRQQRAATSQDLMELVVLPLGKAREIADAVFGQFSDDIMAHRKEIKGLLERKNQALKDAKENGGVREKQMREQSERQAKDMQSQIANDWQSESKSALEDPKFGEYFKPKEGNQEWNQRLGKGFQLVDQAYSENPADPRLTPEQRAAAIRRHVAVRNRAASWGALRFENERLTTRLAEAEKELAEIKSSVPPAGGSEPSNGNAAPSGSAMERMMQELRKKAKPA